MKLSVITINYNNIEGLQKTIPSVLAQKFKDFEYLVIDGGSTDGSAAYIEENAARMAYWVSEKDSGVYNAMNKGIKQSKGEYLLFLNSGDYILDENSLQILEKYECKEDIIYWNLKNNITGQSIIYPDELRFSFFLKATINHQSAIIKRQLFDRFGLYNESFKLVSDWEFFIKTIFLGCVSTKHLNEFIIQYDFRDGLSSRIENSALLTSERNTVLQQHFKGFLNDYEEAEIYQDRFTDYKTKSIVLNTKIVKSLRAARKILKSGFKSKT